MSNQTGRLIEAAQERYGWTDTTLLGVLTDYIARQDSDEALADYLAERGPEDYDDEEYGDEEYDESQIADLRGSMAGGYDDDRVNRVLGAISDATGLDLVCVWDYYDDTGVGGDSQFYVQGQDGELRELAGDLWPWLNGDPADPETPATPGDPPTWLGERAAFTTADLAWDDGGWRNYAHEDRH